MQYFLIAVFLLACKHKPEVKKDVKQKQVWTEEYKRPVPDTIIKFDPWFAPDTLVFKAERKNAGDRLSEYSDAEETEIKILGDKVYINNSLYAIVQNSGVNASLDLIKGSAEYYYQYHIIAPGEGNYIDVYFSHNTGDILSVWVYSNWKATVYHEDFSNRRSSNVRF